jgi:ABC-type Na+ efflux pump permease subunit
VAFSTHRALAVFWKDFLDLRKNKGLLWSMGVFPLVFVAGPVGIVWAYVHNPSDGTLVALAHFYEPGLRDANTAARFLVDKALADWFGLYLIMPVFVPILISSQSVAGEKERRTLEPLLASPVSAEELVAGKSLAALIPALGVTWLSFGLLAAAVDIAAWPLVKAPLLPNGMWMFGIFVVCPLFAFFGNGVAVLVSARVGDARLAQQLSALVTLPLLGLVGAQVAGLLKSGGAYYGILALLVFLLDLVIVRASVRLLDRERLISRWT